MTVVSYAQNQEDIMLHRVLRDVSHGFYVDVGAQQPIVDSVTKLFYDQGWRGINIDPLPQWHRMLEEDRPHDINLQLALGEQPGRISLYAIADTGLSTADQEFARRHAELGYEATEIVVDVRTLDDVCAQYAPADVHFLKIDVEGAEEGVLRGFSFERIRPWVVVVEAVEPVAQREGDAASEAVTTHQRWEPILLEKGYEFVYWDGLNRFYLAKEHLSLRNRFDAPPNPLDAFVRYNDLAKHARILQLEAERKGLVDAAELASLRQRLGDFHGLAESAQNRLYRIGELEQEAAHLQGRLAALEEHNRVMQDVVALLREDVERAGSLSFERDQLKAELAQRLGEMEGLRSALTEAQTKLDQVIGSRSWQMTKPFRFVGRVFRGNVKRPALIDANGRSLPKRAARRVMFIGARFLQEHPAARRAVERMLGASPSLRARLAAFSRHNAPYINPDAAASVHGAAVAGRHGRSPDVSVIYARMQSVISSSKNPR
ncbi:FkbM family methyltransferase [Dyella japonica]|uniref:FkbM family methyltransferase n=1 Tax=Dyella japonica TaxID=231455 RepID=A0ABV2JYF0_9GAMM